jgi:hypothetical protein
MATSATVWTYRKTLGRISRLFPGPARSVINGVVHYLAGVGTAWAYVIMMGVDLGTTTVSCTTGHRAIAAWVPLASRAIEHAPKLANQAPNSRDHTRVRREGKV